MRGSSSSTCTLSLISRIRCYKVLVEKVGRPYCRLPSVLCSLSFVLALCPLSSVLLSLPFALCSLPFVLFRLRFAGCLLQSSAVICQPSAVMPGAAGPLIHQSVFAALEISLSRKTIRRCAFYQPRYPLFALSPHLEPFASPSGLRLAAFRGYLCGLAGVDLGCELVVALSSGPRWALSRARG